MCGEKFYLAVIILFVGVIICAFIIFIAQPYFNNDDGQLAYSLVGFFLLSICGHGRERLISDVFELRSENDTLKKGKKLINLKETKISKSTSEIMNTKPMELPQV